MFLKLFLLFTTIPLIEFYFLLKLGRYIGLYPTLGVIAATGLAGGLLAKHQGLAVFRKAMEELKRGVLPAESLFDGVIILLASALLITPGLLTDILGTLLLIPWSRRIFKAWLKRKLQEKLSKGEIRIYKGFYFKGKDRGPYESP